MGENELATRDDYSPIADDFLLQVAEQAERRIDAVIKIKQTALKVTNNRDWTSQNENPYLQVSGSEKIANLFNISWRIDEPAYAEEPDGHFSWTYKGYFSLGGRTIEVIGTRTSKDGFFSYGGKKKPHEIDKGDVKKAALTNLLGNGITRILGIRNLTWDDLKVYANIDKENVGKVEYKKKDDIKPPQAKGEGSPAGEGQGDPALISEAQGKRLYAIAKGAKWEDEALHVWLKENFNLDSTRQITKAQYENIVEQVKQGPSHA